MRIRVIKAPDARQLDGIPLARFVVGEEYDVPALLGAVFLADGWAVPVEAVIVEAIELPPHAAKPFSIVDDPPNLKHDSLPPYLEDDAGATNQPPKVRRITRDDD